MSVRSRQRVMVLSILFMFSMRSVLMSRGVTAFSSISILRAPLVVHPLPYIRPARHVFTSTRFFVDTSISSTSSTSDDSTEEISSLDSKLDDNDESSLWSKRGPLFGMTRPSSIPGVLLFHMIGTYLALAYMGSTNEFWNVLLKQPGMWLTLLCEVLVSSTSMVVNDYYDAKLGRDVYKEVNLQKKVLLSGKVSLPVAKKFATFLYSMALLLVCCLPGTPTRLSVTTSLMVTYLYTKHLKPMFGVKNVVCASLVALTPWTSASAALYLDTTTTSALDIFEIPSLWRLFFCLLFGVLGREIMLDCNDVVADERAGISTLPLVHGRGVSSAVALVTTVLMSLIATIPPLLQVLQQGEALSNASLSTLLYSSPTRQLTFALVASVVMLRRSFQVYQTRGEDVQVNSRAVDESLLTVVFLLASFV